MTVEKARGPFRESLRRHIDENINYPTEEELAEFRLRNARRTVQALGVEASAEVLIEVLDRRIHFNPYSESEEVMEELTRMGLPLYVVSNWDVVLEGVLDGLGWTRYFSGIIASAKVGSDKPAKGIFEEALRMSGVPRSRAVHVGNDSIAEVWGAASCGVDAVLVNRKGVLEAPEAVVVIPNLSWLPALVRS